MKNYVSDGGVVQYVAPAAHTSGQGYVVGAMFVIAQANWASGQEGSGVIEGIVRLPKGAAVFSLGETVFWDDTAKLAKESATGYFKVGYATKAAATGETEVEVKLNGHDVVAV